MSRIRSRAPEFTMADVYDLPRLRRMAETLAPAASVQLRIHDDPATPAPDGAAMAAELSAGARVILHSGHGQPWGWEGCLDQAVVDAAAQPACAEPILFSAGCSTAERRAISRRRCLMAGVTMATKCASRMRRCGAALIR